MFWTYSSCSTYDENPKECMRVEINIRSCIRWAISKQLGLCATLWTTDKFPWRSPQNPQRMYNQTYNFPCYFRILCYSSRAKYENNTGNFGLCDIDQCRPGLRRRWGLVMSGNKTREWSSELAAAALGSVLQAEIAACLLVNPRLQGASQAV